MERKTYILILIAIAVFAIAGSILARSDLQKAEYEKSNFRCSLQKGAQESVITIDLLDGSAVVLGRESWEKGEIIRIQTNSPTSDKRLLKIGIVRGEDMARGWSYDSYANPIVKTIEISGMEKTVEIQVPETGEYGIYVMDITEFQDGAPNELGGEEIAVESEKIRIPNTRRGTEKRFKEDESHFTVELKFNKEFKKPLIK